MQYLEITTAKNENIIRRPMHSNIGRRQITGAPDFQFESHHALYGRI